MNRWIHRKVAHAYSLINLPLCFLFTFHMCVSMSACMYGYRCTYIHIHGEEHPWSSSKPTGIPSSRLCSGPHACTALRHLSPGPAPSPSPATVCPGFQVAHWSARVLPGSLKKKKVLWADGRGRGNSGEGKGWSYGGRRPRGAAGWVRRGARPESPVQRPRAPP